MAINIGLMGRRPVQTRNMGLMGLPENFADPAVIDEWFMQQQAARQQAAMPSPAVQAAPGGAVTGQAMQGPAKRERVSALSVLGRVLAPATFGAIDSERTRLQAEADRPQMLARSQENEAIARALGPEALLALRTNSEELGKSLAGWQSDMPLAEGTIRNRAGRNIAGSPVVERFDDRFGVIDPTNPGAGVSYTAPRGMTAQEQTARFNAENPVVGANARWLDSAGQVRGEGYIAPEVVSTPAGGTTNVFDAQGRVINQIQGNPSATSARPLSRGQEAKLEEYYGDVASIESTQQELDRIDGLIASGSLNLGPVTNAVSGARNFLNMSDQNSRNYADFQATLQKLINDSLRLNKGVQTEGDAQRAATEILRNPRDEGVVRAQLARLRQINQRALQFRQERIGALEGQGAASGGSSGPIAEDAEGNRVQWNGSAWVPI